MSLITKLKFDDLENISVAKKVNYLVKLTQILGISAILTGIVGMLISNFSIRSLNEKALEPLGHLQLIKESYEQKILVSAQNIAQGNVTDYLQAEENLKKEKEKIDNEWNAYLSGHLTYKEKQILPDAKKFIDLSDKSLDVLINAVHEKRLMQIISWRTDDAPYTIVELTPILNQLMQVQITNAQNIYSTTQTRFFSILTLIILISIAGFMYVAKMVRRVVEDLTQPFTTLLLQSNALANERLDEPFIWNRTDEIGQVGKSFELSRQALHHLFEQIQVKNKELLLNARLAQMGELISMIAHQWRQPLGAIASTAINIRVQLEMERFDLSVEEERAAFNLYFSKRLDDIEEYVESLTTTIDDFRNFYRPDKKMVIATFEDVTKKALKIIRNSIEMDNIKIIEEYCDETQHELFDNELTQVILNLLKNAQDNFREKATVNPLIHIRAKNNLLTVCDNGGGISDDIIEKIFDPYFSTKDEKNGTGLGLHMSKVIVDEHHQGTLRARNQHEGVCFEIIIRGAQ
jgi:signal transduction histidine kinase